MARVASNDAPDVAGDADVVQLPAPQDNVTVGSTTKEEQDDSVSKKPQAKEMISADDEDDDDEGAVWAIGGKKK